jgi:hypothetical protein
MPETHARSFTIAHRHYQLAPSLVVKAVRLLQPEPLHAHFVVIGQRRFPPKQVLSEVTGLDRADFTTHQARRILANLGFAVGRRALVTDKQTAGADKSHAEPDPSFEPFVGQWVALRGTEVLVASPTPGEVVSWLARHHQRADTMFRVPEDELAATGLAPL